MKRRTLKIAYVFPGGCDGMGGAETQALSFLVLVDKVKVSPKLLLLGPNPTFEKAAERAGFLEVDVLCRSDYHPWHPTLLKAYFKYLRENRFDLVHLFGLKHEIVTRPLSTWAHKTRVVSAIRGMESHRGKSAVLLNRMTKRWVDLWISNSGATRDLFMERDGIPGDKIAVVPNGVGMGFTGQERESTRKGIRQELGIPSDSIACICLANHLPDKRISDVLRASANVISRGQKLAVVLVGRPSEHTEEIRKIGADLDLGNDLHILGYRNDVSRVLAGMDIMILASRKEGMPSSLLEGMAAGLPVIATNIASIPEIVQNEETGFIVAVGDVEAITGHMERLAAAKQLRENMGEKGRELVAKKYSREAMTSALLQTYQTLCES